MQHLALVLYKEYPKHAHYYVLKLLCMFHLTALLECINLFVFDVVSMFQNEYYTSNKDLKNIGRASTSQLHPCSCIAIF